MLTAEQVVERQLEYYNAHDIEGFLSTYSANTKIYSLPGTTPIMQGHDAMRERYTMRFSNPNLHATIKSRMVNGNFVVDFEVVSGIEEGKVSEVIAIYEVQNSLIQNVWFLRQ